VTAVAFAFAAGVLGALGLTLLAGGCGDRLRTARGASTGIWALARLGRRVLPRRRAPRELEDLILASGRPAGLGARELMAAKLAAAVLAGIAGAAVGAAAPGRLGVLVALGAPVAGFLAPDRWLRRRAAARARAVRRDLPGMLDLLRVTVDAGASIQAALAEVGARTRGPLAAEWRAVARQAALGISLDQALADTARRLPQPEVEALCAALARARRHGAPLGRTLAAQAKDARSTLRRRVQEEAARAGPKIQLVVALMLVPSVLLLVAAGLATALLDSGGVDGLGA
jgi:tight adherence protein C